MMIDKMLELLDVLSKAYDVMPYDEADEFNAVCLNEVTQIFKEIDEGSLDELIAVKNIRNKLDFFRGSIGLGDKV